MIIGLNGEAGAGKNAVADVLVKNYGFVQMAFADSLKEFTYAFNPMINAYSDVQSVVDDIGWDEAKHRYPEIRRLLQSTGVLLREMDKDVWVKAVNRKISKSNVSNIVITDLRFENELKFLMDRNAAVVKIARPDNPLRIPATHVSEQMKVSTPYIIENDGSGLSHLETLVNDKFNIWNFKQGYTKKYLANGKLVCNSCEQWKPLVEYPSDKRTTWKVSSTCRSCTNEKSKEKQSRSRVARTAEYRKIDKSRLFELGRIKRLAQYGISPEEYNLLLEKQGGVCAICLQEETRKHHQTGKIFSLAVDHDHETGKVRGLLCTKCNKAVGALGDNHEKISRVLMYLSKEF